MSNSIRTHPPYEEVAESSFDAFTVTPRALHLVFREEFEYVWADDAEADVAWADLRSLLRTDGPVADLGVDQAAN